MNKFNIVVILLVLIVTSCDNEGSKKEMSDNQIELFNFSKDDIDDNYRKLKISDLYKNITGFSLDNAGGPLGNVSKVVIFRNILFVLDSHYAKKIFAYNLEKEGKFLFSIGDRGKGPGEFLKVSDFAIDSISQQLLVIDAGQRRMSYFDLDGNFQNMKKLSFEPMKIFYDKNFLYVTEKAYNDGFCLKIMDDKLNILKEYLPSKNYPSIANYNSGFLKIENKLLLNYPNCDTIFQIEGSSIIPYLAIDSNKHSFYSNVLKNNFTNKNMFLSYVNYIGGKNNLYDNVLFPATYFEDKKLKIFEFTFNKHLYRFLKRKSKSEEIQILGSIDNDLFGSYISLMGYDNNYGTIGVVNPESMLKADLDLARKNQQYISDQLISVMKNANETINPYIIFLK